MHPRKILRAELTALLEAAVPGVSVHVSRSRQLKPGEDAAILLYVMKETISRPQAARGRGIGPLKRLCEVDIVAMRDGRDGDVVDDLDDMCRKIEIALSTRAGLELTSTATDIDGNAQTVRAVNVLSYSAEILDTLNEGHAA